MSKKILTMPRAVILAALIGFLGILVPLVFNNYWKPANKSGSDANINVTGKNKGDKTNYDLRGVSKTTLDQYKKGKLLNDKEIQGLLKILVEKNIALDKRNTEFEKLAKKHNELEKHYAERSADSDIFKKAKERIDEGDYENAEKLFAKSLENNLQISAEKNQAAASDAYELALLKEIQLEYEDAKKYHEKAVKLDPDNPLYLSSVAGILKVLGKYAEAEPLYQKALAIMEDKLSKDHKNVADTLNDLALVYFLQEKYDKALPLYQRVVTIYDDILGKLYEDMLDKNYQDVATTLNNLAELYESQGKYDKALPLYQRAIKIAEKSLGDDHPHTRLFKNNLADLMAEIDKQ